MVEKKEGTIFYNVFQCSYPVSSPQYKHKRVLVPNMKIAFTDMHDV